MLPSYAVYIAVVINAGGVTGYIRDTLRGNTFPHRITWFLWGFIPFVTVAVQLRDHVGIQTVMTFSYFATAMAVLVTSFLARRGSWQVTPFDWACGGVCLAAVAVYAATLKGDLAISLLLTAEFFAAVPTVRKSWKAPETETWTVFLAGVVSSSITLLTVRHWTFPTYALSTWIGLQSGTQVMLVRGRLGPRLRATSLLRTQH
ncbi:MAG: hypothetical protein ABSF89_07110 [Acidimicrobiales bacterium]